MSFDSRNGWNDGELLIWRISSTCFVFPNLLGIQILCCCPLSADESSSPLTPPICITHFSAVILTIICIPNSSSFKRIPQFTLLFFILSNHNPSSSPSSTDKIELRRCNHSVKTEEYAIIIIFVPNCWLPFNILQTISFRLVNMCTFTSPTQQRV